MIAKSLSTALFIIIGLLNADSSSAQVQWRLVGKKGFTENRSLHSRFAFDKSGTLYTCFTPAGGVANAGKVVVMRFDNTSKNWEHVGGKGVTKSLNSKGSIDFDSENNPYLAHGSRGADNTVFKFDGNIWTSIGNPEMLVGAIGSPIIKLTNNDVPYLACNGKLGTEISIIKYNNGLWKPVGPGSPTAREGVVVAMVLDNKTQLPYIATLLEKGSLHYINVFKYDGNTWLQVGAADISEGKLSITTLDLAQDRVSGSIYLSFPDPTNSERATVMKYDNANNLWNAVGSSGFSVGSAEQLSMDINSNGVPYVAFRDLGNDYMGSVMKFTGTDWVYVDSPAFSSPTRLYNTEMLIGPNDIPYVGFMDNDSNFQLSVMKYSTPDTNVGLSNVLLDNEIILYPNPANDYLIVKGINQETHIDIYNTLGQHVYSTSLNQNNNSINIKGLNSGDYFITFGASSQILRFTKL